MNFRPGGRRRTRDFELVPLIDVVFTLLLFFALTTTFRQPEPPPAPPGEGEVVGQGAVTAASDTSGLDVRLPRAGDQGVLQAARSLAIEVGADGTLSVEGQVLTIEALGTALRDAARKAPETTVVLRADEQAPHGRIVAILDLARELGLSDFAIATATR